MSKKTTSSDLTLVGIGASAGGLEAIQQLFDHLPSNTGLAFVIVQHLSPDFKSLMPELLAKHTDMEIFTVEDQQEIRPNCIYLNHRNKNLEVKEGKLLLTEKAAKQSLNLPVDIFFHSLGQEFGDRAIGIVLSGTGSDGSRGVITIKEQGGVTFVQQPDTAQFDGMPKTAISTNQIDFIMPPDQIAERLVRLKSLVQSAESLDAVDDESNVDFYERILHLVLRHTNVDFKQYKRNTLVRRLTKRMHIQDISSMAAYYNTLLENEDELLALQQDFLIGVSSFFRDPEAFEVVKKVALPELLTNSKTEDYSNFWQMPIRIS